MTKDTKCPQCGNAFISGSLFCGNCGKQLDAQQNNSSQKELYGVVVAASNSMFPWIVLAVGVVVTLTLVGMFVFSSQEGGQPQFAELKQSVVSPADNLETARQATVSAKEQDSTAGAEKAQVQPEKPGGNRDQAESFLLEGVQQVQQGDLKGAAELFARATAADQSYGLAWNNLGLAQRKLGDTESALKAYSAAINTQPDFALAYKNMGLVLDEMGEYEAALNAYKSYCDLAPEAKDYEAIQIRMQQLLSQMN